MRAPRSTGGLLSAVAIVMVAGVSPAAADGLTAAQLESRNAAAGFASTFKFGIGRAARNCRDLLGKDDAWMHGIVDNWLERNGRFSHAAETWTSMLVTGIANTRGEEAAQAAIREILTIVRTEGEATAVGFIGKTPDEQNTRCPGYEAAVRSGRYDIPESTPMYKELLELVAVFEEQPGEATAEKTRTPPN